MLKTEFTFYHISAVAHSILSSPIATSSEQWPYKKQKWASPERIQGFHLQRSSFIQEELRAQLLLFHIQKESWGQFNIWFGCLQDSPRWDVLCPEQWGRPRTCLTHVSQLVCLSAPEQQSLGCWRYCGSWTGVRQVTTTQPHHSEHKWTVLNNKNVLQII